MPLKYIFISDSSFFYVKTLDFVWNVNLSKIIIKKYSKLFIFCLYIYIYCLLLAHSSQSSLIFGPSYEKSLGISDQDD